MNAKIFALLLFVLIAWFIHGCYMGNINQDNTSQYNTSQDNSTYPEYNVDDLNQYGDWTNIYPYGRVWCPSVVNNYQPFANGHWSYDGYDWVWVSYEPFGWIVCHYGSWEFSPDLGWYWIPGDEEWTPACVQWIDYGDYVGWAPRRANGRSWTEPWENNNVHPWMVVGKGDFNRENINKYRVPSVNRYDNVNQIQRRQPDVKTIQRYVKDPIGVVKFEREPVVTKTPPVKTINTPERNVIPLKNDNPPVRTETPPVRPETPRNDNPQQRTTTPPVTQRDIKTTIPTNTRNIVHLQVPPTEKLKVNKYRPIVEKEVLVKKTPKTQK
jgi:hypothetical protein